MFVLRFGFSDNVIKNKPERTVNGLFKGQSYELESLMHMYMHVYKYIHVIMARTQTYTNAHNTSALTYKQTNKHKHARILDILYTKQGSINRKSFHNVHVLWTPTVEH